MSDFVSERKFGKKRIMVQVWDLLAIAIEKNFKEMHIKRDGYLNDLFMREIEELEKEVTFRNSDEVRKRFRERPLPNRKKLNLDLDESVVKRIDEVLNARNIPRDSFVNRIFFFLLAKDMHLDYLGIEYDKETETSAKPLNDARWYLLNHFSHIREKNGGNFYTLNGFFDGPFGGKNGPNLFSLNVALSHDYWTTINSEIGELLQIFFRNAD